MIERKYSRLFIRPARKSARRKLRQEASRVDIVNSKCDVDPVLPFVIAVVSCDTGTNSLYDGRAKGSFGAFDQVGTVNK